MALEEGLRFALREGGLTVGWGLEDEMYGALCEARASSPSAIRLPILEVRTLRSAVLRAGSVAQAGYQLWTRTQARSQPTFEMLQLPDLLQESQT